MRLRERDKRAITVYAWTGMDEDVYIWGESQSLRAAVYPHTETISPQVYGDCVKDKKLLLYDGDAELRAGMGVSLDGGVPAYRIVSVERWTHTRAVIEAIAEGRRGP